jgi:hypothetical protein
MMKKYFPIGIPTLALAVIALEGSAGMAQPLPTASSTNAIRPEQHCIIGPNQSSQCFNTEAEALRAASGGRINLTLGQTARSLSTAQLLSSSIQAILYENRDFKGSSLVIYSSSCSGWNNLSGFWNDRVSSLRASACKVTLFEDTNRRGASRTFTGNVNYVGNAINDEASSWQLSR